MYQRAATATNSGFSPGPLGFAAGMPEHDGLSDENLAINKRCPGGTIIGLLSGERKPSLADIRNDGAHGYPFDGFPMSGLLEFVRDLIEYAYRTEPRTKQI